MYTAENINRILSEVFGDNANFYHFFNGERAEGLSVIIPSSISSFALEELIFRINEENPNEKTITEYHIRKVRPELIIYPKTVSESIKRDCFELRLVQKGFYDHPKSAIFLELFKDTIDGLDKPVFDSHDFIRRLMEKHPHLYANILLKNKTVTNAHAEIGRFLLNNSDELNIEITGERVSLDVFLNNTPCALWQKKNKK